MNIILLNTATREHTTKYLGIYQIAYWVRKHGFSCQVIDYANHLDEEYRIKLIEKFIDSSTKVLGISQTFGGEHDTTFNDTIDYIKKKYGLKIVIGGKGPWNQHLLKRSDQWITGTAENTFLHYLYTLFEKDKSKIVPFDIQKLCHEWSDNDIIDPYEPLPMELGRGCIFQCKFCTHENTGKKKGSYLRDFSLIEKEILTNYEKYGTTCYSFTDDTINEDPDKMLFLADLNERLPFDLKWNGYIRADLIHRYDQAELLLRAGMVSCFFGIETFNEKAAMAIGKGWMGKKGKDYLVYLNELWKGRCNFHANFIAGLPYEQPNEWYETVDWVIKNDIPSARYFVLSLYREKRHQGKNLMSEFGRNAENYGYITRDDGKWYNDTIGMHKDQTSQHVEKFEKILWNRNRLAGWQILEAYHETRLPYKQLQNMLYKDFWWNQDMKTRKRIKMYFEKLEEY